MNKTYKIPFSCSPCDRVRIVDTIYKAAMTQFSKIRRMSVDFTSNTSGCITVRTTHSVHKILSQRIMCIH